MKLPNSQAIFGRTAALLRRIPPRAVLAIAWLWLIVYAFPGQLTQDSFDHLSEARNGVYTDAHPPFINALWKCIDRVIAGQFGMLVLQSTLLLAGLYHVLQHTFSPRRAAWVAAAVFVFPPVMLPMAVIWKDCLMAGGLMIGAAGFLSPRRTLRVAGLLGMFLAAAVRYNALAATFPLVVLLFEWSPGMRWFKRYPLAVAAWLVLTVAALGINARLTDQPMYYWHTSLAVYDIAGTLVNAEPAPSDAEVEALLVGTRLERHEGIVAAMKEVYSTRNFVGLITDPARRLWVLPTGGFVPPPVEQRDAIAAAWQRTVTRYPGAYLVHRLGVMREVIGLGRDRIGGVVTRRELRWPEYAAKELGLSTRSSSWQYAMTDAARWTADRVPIFTPWLYLVLLLAFLPLALRHRDVLALLLSGLALEGTLYVLAPSSDFRYSHWMIICVIVAGITLAARRARGRTAR